ncbi:hypothetical protein [Pseudomonas syringae]|uniref:hypothetical protein n=1 Tax=Pseudomonas syringae TaxID=317 RepID=UPI00137AB33C|nr:hypothetical protein [Pseudomonas syringae]
MLVDQVKTQRFKRIERIPDGLRAAAQSLCETLQLVSAERLPKVLIRIVPCPSFLRVVSQRLLIPIGKRVPLPQVVHFFKAHMSGLRDLVVWKQKATTDAPDTFSA